MRYAHHKYTWRRLFGNDRHQWELVGPDGAVHFTAHDSSNGFGWSCGLEIHYASPPDSMRGQAPSHVDCPLTGGRCWHDGTSLYATETLWPMIHPMLLTGDHATIFRFLEGEADEFFGYAVTEGEP